MPRFFIYIEFDGSLYHGWQIQPNSITVQEEVSKALEIIEQKAIEIVGAGRTDAGVHAKTMVAHFDTETNWEKSNFLLRMNSILPKDIAVFDLRKVKPDFHARFDAVSRTYQYKISRRRLALQQQVYFHKFDLDLESMNRAAKQLLGEKDFSCFSKSHTQTFTNDCYITQAEWSKDGEVFIFTVTANRFLRNMVRAIVGTLIEVGEGKRTVESLVDLLHSKDRKLAGVSVPACGLTLSAIDYPKEGFI